MGNNRKRILTEALSLDAWHDPFKLDGNKLGVFVEITFNEGRLGGNDTDLPFTFKLGLKRAILTIDLEEPLEIDRRSIARSIPENVAELSRVLGAKQKAQTQRSYGGSLTPAALHVSLSGKAHDETEVTHEDELRIIQTIPQTLVIPRPLNRHSYSWTMEPSWQPTLQGQPWNPVDPPRLKIKPINSLNAVMPAIRVNISCAFEDIHITDILPKGRNTSEIFKEMIFNEANVAAAKQHLKLVLRDADLEPGKLDNRFSSLIIASILATPEP